MPMLFKFNASLYAKINERYARQNRCLAGAGGTALDEKEVTGMESFEILNYEDTLKQLDIYYGIVKRQLLRFQSPTNGLFPELSKEERVGSVRDSIYCAYAIWALHQGYRRIDDDRGKAHGLGQSVVKCMRGIMECWIRQSSCIELFKKMQSAKHALHVKFDLETGNQIEEEIENCHLQIDIVSLYLIFLVQIITSGLQVIYTHDEVTFIQNLVYYVERAYRTPDWGMWQRGSKYNDNTPEIHASSIGMAKAALEAINGVNLFGEKGASWSVVYVDIDAHSRNRSIFKSLLPRESSSKNTDASLLTAIGFPAFATHEELIYNKTKFKVIKKLQGKYGFRRFVRDGYKTVLESPDRKFYKRGETKEFERVECEWPLFYMYMIIDGVFKGLTDQIETFCKLASNRITRNSLGDPIIPMYYYVPREKIELERKDPGSQERLKSEEGSEDNLFLWGQSVYIIAQLLTSGLTSINEIDPIRRYLPSSSRPRRAFRYSAFQSTANDLVVQVVLIAESTRLKSMMATYGIQTQTPQEVEPVEIWSPNQLIKIYEHLGVNKKLGLKGRPRRPIGALGTSKIYRVFGRTVLSYPLIFEVSDFYLSHDMSLLIDDIKTELLFVSKNWRLSGRPTMGLIVREEFMRDGKFKEMLDLFADLKRGYCNGVKVRVGRLQNLLSSSCIEHLDFMNMADPEALDIVPFQQLVHVYTGYQSLTDIPKAINFHEDVVNYDHFKHKETHEIMEAYKFTPVDSYYGRCQLLGYILERVGYDHQIDGISVREHITRVNRQAGALRLWRAVRYASSLLHQLVDSISPNITTILVNGKQLTVGVIGKDEAVFDKPMSPGEIEDIVYSTIQKHDVIQAVLQQEIALYCGKLISNSPALFEGVLKIRSGWVLQAVKLYMEYTDVKQPLESLSPSELRRIMEKVLNVRLDYENGKSNGAKLTVFQKRQIEGCLCRVPKGFYGQVWHILEKTPTGIHAAGKVLPNELCTHMSLSELNFALEVEKVLHNIAEPEYIQIVIQLLCVVSTILKRNPELRFKKSLDVDRIVSNAFDLFLKDMRISNSEISKSSNSIDKNSKEQDLYPFINASPTTSTGYLARAAVNFMLQGDMLDLYNLSEVNALSESCAII